MHWFLSQQKYIKIYTSVFTSFVLTLKSNKNHRINLKTHINMGLLMTLDEIIVIFKSLTQ